MFSNSESSALQVNEAEEERLRSEREHQRVTQLCQQAEAKVQSLQKSLKRVILKSKPYFELKVQFNQILEVRPTFDLALSPLPMLNRQEGEQMLVFARQGLLFPICPETKRES